jgi:BirA family biotin operon repressor/biotin-[acetyl-CoA-carboxylase] ligase
VSGRLGHPRLHLRTVDSTNLRARALAAAGTPHGTLVTAAEQTAGRGRQGRRWSAPAGRSLLMSLVLRDPPPLLALGAGVAVARVAETLDAGGRRAGVKWPNDVLLDGRKVAGILVEGRPQDRWAVLGIGLNVAVRDGDLDPETAARATGLGREPGDAEAALPAVLSALEQVLMLPAAEMLSALRARDALRGRPVRWAQGTGVGAGIDDDGRLCVDTGEATLTLQAGEVHLAADGHSP